MKTHSNKSTYYCQWYPLISLFQYTKQLSDYTFQSERSAFTSNLIIIGMNFIFVDLSMCIWANQTQTDYLSPKGFILSLWVICQRLNINKIQKNKISFLIIPTLLWKSDFLAILLHILGVGGENSCTRNLSKCITFSPAKQIVWNKHNDDELELCFLYIWCTYEPILPFDRNWLSNAHFPLLTLIPVCPY